MDTIEPVRKKRGTFIYGHGEPKRKLTDEQLFNQFKIVYGKKPTQSELRQYKLFNQGK